MSLSILDNPLINQTIFFPRSAPRQSDGPYSSDGLITVEDGVQVGYRFYHKPTDRAVIVYFHGNGEIAADYDSIAALYHDVGAALLALDFRGYGWSTGSPSATALIKDAEPIFGALDTVLAPHDLHAVPRYVMGRSLGSAPAIQMASQHAEAFRGLIIESGFARVLHLLLRRGFPSSILPDGLDPIGNLAKIKTLSLPLLVLHGEQDELIPVQHGQDLHDASPAEYKQILRLPKAGHNTMLMFTEPYFKAIAAFLAHTHP